MMSFWMRSTTLKGAAHSQTRGRHQMPAEVVLRMPILKQVRNWSYETLEREVAANAAAYRSFCRIGLAKSRTPRRSYDSDRLVAIAPARKAI